MAILALLIQQVKESCGLLADEVDAADVVVVVNVIPRDAFSLILSLEDKMKKHSSVT